MFNSNIDMSIFVREDDMDENRPSDNLAGLEIIKVLSSFIGSFYN